MNYDDICKGCERYKEIKNASSYTHCSITPFNIYKYVYMDCVCHNCIVKSLCSELCSEKTKQQAELCKKYIDVSKL